MNCFAIYDVSAIEDITGVPSQDPDPWLEVEAIVVDESNFKTDRCVSFLLCFVCNVLCQCTVVL